MDINMSTSDLYCRRKKSQSHRGRTRPANQSLNSVESDVEVTDIPKHEDLQERQLCYTGFPEDEMTDSYSNCSGGQSRPSSGNDAEPRSEYFSSLVLRPRPAHDTHASSPRIPPTSALAASFSSDDDSGQSCDDVDDDPCPSSVPTPEATSDYECSTAPSSGPYPIPTQYERPIEFERRKVSPYGVQTPGLGDKEYYEKEYFGDKY